MSNKHTIKIILFLFIFSHQFVNASENIFQQLPSNEKEYVEKLIKENIQLTEENEKLKKENEQLKEENKKTELEENEKQKLVKKELEKLDKLFKDYETLKNISKEYCDYI